MMDGITSFIVQLFFCWRIWVNLPYVMSFLALTVDIPQDIEQILVLARSYLNSGYPLALSRAFIYSDGNNLQVALAQLVGAMASGIRVGCLIMHK